MPDRLETAADRIEIQMLLGRIAQLADKGSPEEYLECFTSDATWRLTDATGIEMSEEVRHGHADLLIGVQERRSIGMQGPGTNTKHDISTSHIRIEGDRASAVTYYRYYRNTHQTPQLVTMGQYEDEFARTPAGWQLASRIIRRQ